MPDDAYQAFLFLYGNSPYLQRISEKICFLEMCPKGYFYGPQLSPTVSMLTQG
jgi:hypothetical protein